MIKLLRMRMLTRGYGADMMEQETNIYYTPIIPLYNGIEADESQILLK